MLTRMKFDTSDTWNANMRIEIIFANQKRLPTASINKNL